MSSIASFVKRHPLATFVALAYLLSWCLVLPSQGMLIPHGPFFAAIIVVALTAGKAGLKDFFARVFRQGAALRWFALAFALPVGITFSAAGLNLVMGARLPSTIDWS